MSTTRVVIIGLWGFYVTMLYLLITDGLPRDSTLTPPDHLSAVLLWVLSSLWLVNFSYKNWNLSFRSIYQTIHTKWETRRTHHRKSMG